MKIKTLIHSFKEVNDGKRDDDINKQNSKFEDNGLEVKATQTNTMKSGTEEYMMTTLFYQKITKIK